MAKTTMQAVKNEAVMADEELNKLMEDKRGPSLVEEIVMQDSFAKVEGKDLVFFCARYAYCGHILKINEDYVVLEGAKLPFETGEFNTKEWKSIDKFPNGRWSVMLAAVESFGILK
jgi:hypothetical protein